MKNTSVLLVVLGLLASVFAFQSCEDENHDDVDDGRLEVRFRALLDGTPYNMNERFVYDGREMNISTLHFYLSEMVLVQGNFEAQLSEIARVDFADSGITAEEGVSFTFSGLPLGTYDGLKMGIGVPSDLNAQAPETYSPSHPLYDVSDYWADWGSYIFHKIEGRYDDDGNAEDLEKGFNFHVGGDDMYREKAFEDMEIEVTADGQTEIVIDLEILELLEHPDGTAFDLPNIGNIHTAPGQEEMAGIIANNWVDGFSLSQ